MYAAWILPVQHFPDGHRPLEDASLAVSRCALRELYILGMQTSPMRRSISLDVLRGLAVLLVIGRHYEYRWLWYKIGWSGVDLFFVLSGYLIAGLIFREFQQTGTIDLKRFWIRRGFKIYPGFYAMIIYVIVYYLGLGKLTFHIFSDLFFLQDYITPIASHGWSLGVEEKFYFALPILLLVLIRTHKKSTDPFSAIPYLFILFFVVCLVLRINAVAGRSPWDEIYRPAHLRMDCLFAGVCIGYFKEFRPEAFRRIGSLRLWIPATVLLAPIAIFDLDTPAMVTFGFSAASLGFASLVLWLDNRTLPDWRFFACVAWIGRYSYPIYLWHLIVKSKLGYSEANWGLVSLPFYVATSIGVGWLMGYLVEAPFLKLRDKFFPARTSGSIPSLAASPYLESASRDATADDQALPRPLCARPE